MKAIEFETRLNPDRTLSVPAGVADQVEPGQAVRVLLLIDDASEERDWKRMAAAEFLKGYAESDAIYDQLSGR
jgi:hypothetical protein